MAIENIEPGSALQILMAELHTDVLNVHHSIKDLAPAVQEAVGDVPVAIRDATSAAVASMEKAAEAQAYWIEQETLKDRDAFLAQQKEVYGSFVAEMKALIAVQNTALESVLLRVGALTVDAIKKEVGAAVAAVPRADNKTLVKVLLAVGIGLIVAVAISAGVTLALYLQVN